MTRMFVTVAVSVILLGCSGSNEFVGEWRDANGNVLPDESTEGEGFVIDSWRVTGHCDWGSATFLLLSWPPGRLHDDWVTSDIEDGTVRLYVRDPEGLFQDLLLGEFAPDVGVPDGATTTGIHLGEWEILLVGGGADTTILLKGADRVEEWQRATTFIACA